MNESSRCNGIAKTNVYINFYDFYCYTLLYLHKIWHKLDNVLQFRQRDNYFKIFIRSQLINHLDIYGNIKVHFSFTLSFLTILTVWPPLTRWRGSDFDPNFVSAMVAMYVVRWRIVGRGVLFRLSKWSK